MEFTTATALTWFEVPHGGEGPTSAAVRGESLLGTRPNNPVSRAAAQLAEDISRRAHETAAIAGRSV
jgi:hypothetical protein